MDEYSLRFYLSSEFSVDKYDEELVEFIFRLKGFNKFLDFVMRVKEEGNI